MESLFLPRKPGVFAYAALTSMWIYSLVLPQRTIAEQSMYVVIEEVYLSFCDLSNFWQSQAAYNLHRADFCVRMFKVMVISVNTSFTYYLTSKHVYV